MLVAGSAIAPAALLALSLPGSSSVADPSRAAAMPLAAAATARGPKTPQWEPRPPPQADAGTAAGSTAAATAAAATAAAAATTAEDGRPSLRSNILTVLSVPSIRWLLVGAATRLFAGFAIGAWVAPYYRSAFASHSAAFSVINCMIVAGGGTVAVVCGGIASDRVTKGGASPERAALIPMLGSLLAIPFFLGAVRCTHFGVAMACLLGAYLCGETWFGATIAMMQSAVPSRGVTGTAQVRSAPPPLSRASTVVTHPASSIHHPPSSTLALV